MRGEVMENNFYISFPKSRHADYEESVELAMNNADAFKEKKTKEGIVNFAMFTYSKDSLAKAIILIEKISRYPHANFSSGKTKMKASESLDGLTCYYSAICPEKAGFACLPEDDNFKTCLFCKRIFMENNAGHPWWTTGSFEKKEDESLVWRFNKSRIKSEIKAQIKEIASCPIIPVEKFEVLINSLPDEMPITIQSGFIDFYKNIGLNFDLTDYIRDKSSEYESHGEDLVIVTHHSPTCALCRHWHGKIYSISGSSYKYPPLKLAIQGGLFHPGCIHCESLYIGVGSEDSYNTLVAKQNNRQYTKSQLGGCGCALHVGISLLFLIILNSIL